jgi:hypothetical protein
MPEVETPERTAPTPDSPFKEEEQTEAGPQAQATDEQERPEDEDDEGDKGPDLNALLDKADPEELRKHKRIAGIAGELAKKLATREAERLATQRADEIVREREQLRAAEASRQALIEAAKKGEYYALGEQVSKNLLVEDQQRYMGQFQNQAKSEAYSDVQKAVDEIAEGFDESVITAAAEAVGEFPPGTAWQDGFKKWLPELVKAQAKYLASNPEARKQVEREVTPAVRSRALAELNGAEPVADSGGGRPQKAKTVTDEDIERMEPDEWMTVYDVDKGRFKPGYVYKPTRAIDPRRMQVSGRGF